MRSKLNNYIWGFILLSNHFAHILLSFVLIIFAAHTERGLLCLKFILTQRGTYLSVFLSLTLVDRDAIPGVDLVSLELGDKEVCRCSHFFFTLFRWIVNANMAHIFLQDEVRNFFDSVLDIDEDGSLA